MKLIPVNHKGKHYLLSQMCQTFGSMFLYILQYELKTKVGGIQ